MLERGQKHTQKKVLTVLGVFEFDAFLSCVFGFLEKGGVGGGWGSGEAPPPKKMRDAVLCQ